MTNGDDFINGTVVDVMSKDASGRELISPASNNPMTKREAFAMAAMQGLMANPERYSYVTAKVESREWSHVDATRHNAEKAVYLADALIAALNQEAA